MASHDGGPAFPREDYQGGGLGQSGMTLLDYCAVAAMAALLRNSNDFTLSVTRDDLAGEAYRMAAAMLQARAALGREGR